MRVIRVLLVVGILMVGMAAAEATFLDFSEYPEDEGVNVSGHRNAGHIHPSPRGGGGNGGGGAPGSVD